MYVYTFFREDINVSTAHKAFVFQRHAEPFYFFFIPSGHVGSVIIVAQHRGAG